MNKRMGAMGFVYALIIAMLAACGASPTAGVVTARAAVTQVASPTIAVTPSVTLAATSPVTTTVAVGNRKNHDDAKDYVWDSAQVVRLVLQGNTISANGAGVTAAGNKATITAPGTYSLSGTLADGRVVVNTTSKGTVRLILNGVDMRSSTSAPIYVMNADKTVIVLADNTRNTIADAKTYVQVGTDDEPNAAIFSKGDLTIFGNGALTVEGNYNDGIASKDGLIIASGTITVRAADDGIRGKDYLIVKSGSITVTAQGDGLKSDEAEDVNKGYVVIENGTLNVTAVGDAIQAQTDVLAKQGKFTLLSGGGSTAKMDANLSAKGVKGASSVQIEGGTWTIDTADDAIHSNNRVVIKNGTFTIATGDDAMHADTTLQVDGGTINITKSYEGLESAQITINGGDLYVVSSDDGLNGAGGNDGSGMMPAPGARPGRDAFAAASKYSLYINGGYIVVSAVGDGVDINGSIEMTNGTLIVNGPIARMNSALDYDRTFKLTGGFLIAVGSSGMAQAPDDSSTQPALLLDLTTVQRAGTLVQIRNAEGKPILTFAPTKDYQSIAFSCASLVKGATYQVYLGGTVTGVGKDGSYPNSAVTTGMQYTSFTTTAMVTRIGVNRSR